MLRFERGFLHLSGMLQMLMDTELDTTQQDFVVTAQESGKALINLINEVLDLAKIESGRIELEAVPFDVRDILDNVVSLFSEKSQTKGIEVRTNFNDGMCSLKLSIYSSNASGP
jgi:arabidopsis histidine kinase 2/3/4 (cytokinin receptor)